MVLFLYTTIGTDFYPFLIPLAHLGRSLKKIGLKKGDTFDLLRFR